MMRRRSSLKRFLLASLALHIVALAVVKFDAIRETLRELPVIEALFAESQPPEPVEAAEKPPEPDPALLAAQQEKLAREEAAREEITAQLKTDFEQLAAPLTMAELKQELLDQMLERMAEQIAAQAERAADPAADPAATQAQLADLRQEFAAQLRPAVETLLARHATEVLREAFVPALAREYEGRVAMQIDRSMHYAVAEVKRAAAQRQQEEAFREALAELAPEVFPERAQEEFAKDFEQVGLSNQLQQATQIFRERATHTGMHSEHLEAEFSKMAKEMLRAEVPEQTKAGQYATQDARAQVGHSVGPAGGQPGKEAQQAELTQTFENILAAKMPNLTAAPSRANEQFRNALHQALGAAPAVLELRAFAAHAQETLRGNSVDAAAGEHPDVTGLETPLHTDSRYEAVESLAPRAGPTALALEGETLEAAAAPPVAEEAGELRASRLLLPKQPAAPSATDDAPYAPPFKARRFAVAPCVAPGAITLDGDLSDWEGIPVHDLPGAENHRPSVRFAWRPGGLYVAIAAADPDNTITKAGMGVYWQGDAVDVYLDMPNRKGQPRTPGDGTHQFAILPEGDHNPAVHGWEFGQHTGQGHSFVHVLNEQNIGRGFRKLDHAWNLELFFPADRLAEPRPALGRFIGADVSVATGRGIVYWAGGYASSWNAPGKWGDVLLSGSDAVVETRAVANPPGAWQATNTVFVAGRPLEIRVTDPDMNRDPAAVERVRVLVSAATGARETALLTETGSNTGIFEGRLPTALALGQPQPGVLDCHEGDVVRVTYVDRFRAAGPRSREVTATAVTALEIVASGE